MVQEMLKASKYDYARGTACGYHELEDVQLHCALGNMMHRAIIICNKLCPLLKIELQKGRHLPPIISRDEVKKDQAAWEARMKKLSALKGQKAPPQAFAPEPRAHFDDEEDVRDYDVDGFADDDASTFFYGSEDDEDDESLADELDAVVPASRSKTAPFPRCVQDFHVRNEMNR
jgi:hypothetical protein